MRVRSFRAFIVLFFAAVFGSTFIPQIRILGGQPDFILIFVLTWAALSSVESGIVWAFIGGALHDLMSSAPMGTTILALLVVVFALEGVRSQIVSIGLITVLALIVIGTFTHKIVLLGVLALAGFNIDPVQQFTYNVIPSLGFNLALALPVYWFSRRLLLRPQPLSGP